MLQVSFIHLSFFSSSAATGQSLSPSTNAEAGPGGGGRSDAQAESLRGRAPRGRSLGPDAPDDPGTGGGVSVRSCREKSRGVWSLLPEATPRTVLCSSSRSWRRRVDSGTSPCAFPSSPTFTGTPRETHPSLYPKKILEHSLFFLHPLTSFRSEKYYKNMVIYNRRGSRPLQSLICFGN